MNILPFKQYFFINFHKRLRKVAIFFRILNYIKYREWNSLNQFCDWKTNINIASILIFLYEYQYEQDRYRDTYKDDFSFRVNHAWSLNRNPSG